MTIIALTLLKKKLTIMKIHNTLLWVEQKVKSLKTAGLRHILFLEESLYILLTIFQKELLNYLALTSKILKIGREFSLKRISEPQLGPVIKKAISKNSDMLSTTILTKK